MPSTTRTPPPPPASPPGPPPTATPGTVPGAAPSGSAYADAMPAPTRMPPDARYRSLGWGLASIGLGTVWLLSAVGVAIDWGVVLATALVVVGLLVLLTARRPSDGGLVGLGIALAILTLLVTAVPGHLSISAGDRTLEVVDPVDLEPSYALGAGTLILDLRGLDLTEPSTELAANVGFGELVVRVPEGTHVTGQAGVVMGETVVFGDTTGGIAPNVELGDGPADGPVLELDLQAGLGTVEVTR